MYTEREKKLGASLWGVPFSNSGLESSLSELKDLITRGAPLNWQNEKGWSVLHGVVGGRIEMLKVCVVVPMAPVLMFQQVLLKARADVNIQTSTGWTPLLYAVMDGKIEAMKVCGLLFGGLTNILLL